jgi:hypothetical protein
MFTNNVYLDDVEKRAQVVGSNHTEAVAMLVHGT